MKKRRLTFAVMFIKNQTFSDAETLEEALFDFDLGTASPELLQAQQETRKMQAEDAAHQQELAALNDEEDRAALADEEYFSRLTQLLLQRFDRFEIARQKLYGIKGQERALLAEIDLV